MRDDLGSPRRMDRSSPTQWSVSTVGPSCAPALREEGRFLSSVQLTSRCAVLERFLVDGLQFWLREFVLVADAGRANMFSEDPFKTPAVGRSAKTAVLVLAARGLAGIGPRHVSGFDLEFGFCFADFGLPFFAAVGVAGVASVDDSSSSHPAMASTPNAVIVATSFLPRFMGLLLSGRVSIGPGRLAAAPWPRPGRRRSAADQAEGSSRCPGHQLCRQFWCRFHQNLSQVFPELDSVINRALLSDEYDNLRNWKNLPMRLRAASRPTASASSQSSGKDGRTTSTARARPPTLRGSCRQAQSRTNR